MSIFSQGAIKIYDLLGITTKGQATGANSLPVVLSSDGVAGQTSDAAVVTDTTGTLSGKMRGLVKWAYERMPGALGRNAATSSFPVVLCSEDLSAIGAPPTPKEPVQVLNLQNQVVLNSTDITNQDLRAYSAILFSLSTLGSVPDGSTLRVGILFKDAFGSYVARIRFTDMTATARQSAILIPRQAPSPALGATPGANLTDIASGTITQGPIGEDWRIAVEISTPGASTAWDIVMYVEGIY